MSGDDDALARKRRAEARRASWPDGEVVSARTPEPVLYAGMSAEERLAHMWALCKSQWLASGRELLRIPRDELPGERSSSSVVPAPDLNDDFRDSSPSRTPAPTSC